MKNAVEDGGEEYPVAKAAPGIIILDADARKAGGGEQGTGLDTW